MKKMHAFLLGALFILGLNACVEEQRFLGPIEEETYALSAFTELDAETLGNITLIPSDEYKVVVRSHRVVLDDVTVTAGQGRLLLKYREPALVNRRIETFEYTIYMPFLNRITLKDVANINGYEGFSTDELSLRIEDVGNITLNDISVDYLEAVVNGVGDIKVNGTTSTADYLVQDVGNIRAFDMITEECNARVKGVGDIQLYAAQKLDATIQGVGDIEYKGSPSVTVHIDGQGKVKKRN